MKEHHAKVRHHCTSSALVSHVDKARYLPILKEAKVLHLSQGKKRMKAFEALNVNRYRSMIKG